jgi:hypothetical protein
MSLIDRFMSLFRSAPKLRNKPQGMAWIKGMSERDGDGALNGRAVKTVRLNEHGMWQIEPAQSYIVTNYCTFLPTGYTAWPGEVVTIIGIPDEHLEPWRESGLDAKDESAAWLPPVPKHHREPSRV